MYFSFEYLNYNRRFKVCINTSETEKYVNFYLVSQFVKAQNDIESKSVHKKICK